MKFLLASIALLTASAPAFALEPVQGSITYDNAPHLSLAPVGSVVDNQLTIDGDRYHEIYVVQPDHTLKLVDRMKYSHP